MTDADRGRAIVRLEQIRNALTGLENAARDADTEEAAFLFRCAADDIRATRDRLRAALPPEVIERAGGGAIRDTRQQGMPWA